jgi:nucleoside-diphosphate-sugar epimerase
VCILRPTIVYGPFSASWTIEPAQRLASGHWLIPAAYASGTANVVYVDDLVQAIVLALKREAAIGEAFNVNGGERITWHTYFNALNEALSLPSLNPRGRLSSRVAASAMMPVRTGARLLLKHFQRPINILYQRSRLAKAAMRHAEKLIRRTPTVSEFDLYSRDVCFVTEKAQQLLGYKPLFGLQEGVSLSAAWLKHLRIV